MLAIIPARGRSKGIPGKNLRLLGGIPLICHTIRAALDTKKVTRVIVSTDDKKIADVARSEGAEIPFMRPSELAKDSSLAIDVFLYTIERINREEGHVNDFFVALPPTSPLRLSKDIEIALEIFERNVADSVISVTNSPFPLEWMLKINEKGILINCQNGVKAYGNRQDFEKIYIPNGSIYILNTDLIRNSHQYYSKKTYPYKMPLERSVDIDDFIDLEWAEYLLQKKKRSNFNAKQ